jgi:AcrR family transcriptional regulator
VARGLSERAHRNVLIAATELFANRGIDATSMDAIAAAASVSKATVYKHWADKDALCLDVLLHVHRNDEDPTEQDSGDLRADMKSFLAYEPPAASAEIQRRLTPHLIAYSARNPQFGRAWRARVSERARLGLQKLLHRGMDAGTFPVALDEELSVALLLGPMMYRHIFGPTVDRRWLAEGVVDSFWKAYASSEVKPAVRTRSRVKAEPRAKARSSVAQ